MRVVWTWYLMGVVGVSPEKWTVVRGVGVRGEGRGIEGALGRKLVSARHLSPPNLQLLQISSAPGFGDGYVYASVSNLVRRDEVFWSVVT